MPSLAIKSKLFQVSSVLAHVHVCTETGRHVRNLVNNVYLGFEKKATKQAIINLHVHRVVHKRNQCLTDFFCLHSNACLSCF